MEWMASAICGVLLGAAALDMLALVQGAGYKISPNKKFMLRLRAQFILTLVLALIAAALFIVQAVTGAAYVKLIFFGAQCLCFGMYFLCTYIKSVKLPKFTPRLIRLFCALVVIAFLISRLVIFAGSKLVIAGTVCGLYLMFLLPALIPLLIVAALIFVKPLESIIARRFISRAKSRLDERQGLIRIGITGSYGKTSVKNMLAALLGDAAYATPASYNTPMGICKAVNDMPADVKYFLCEMGARRTGDIAELCGIVRPRVGVITGIAPQHMQTFKTLDNIIAAKGELIESLPCNGAAVFNGYDENAVKMYRNCSIRKRYMTKKGVYFENALLTPRGSAFDLVCENERASCELPLIGRHNIQNFCLAAQVCLALGMSLQEVAARAKYIKPVPHRLEVIDTGRGITVIDDGYNSNVRGAKAALDALAGFDGRKIVAAQGFAEAGNKDAEFNIRLGEQIAAVADIAILIGVKAKLIEQGLTAHFFPRENIYITSSLTAAREIFGRILLRGDVLLIENDLPENA